MVASSFALSDLASPLFSGLVSGLFLTLMDRIDEHHIVERHRALLAYLAGGVAAGLMAWSIEQFPVVYPLFFGLLLEWIIKDKINFPSHVFWLFLLALFLGHRIDLFQCYWPYTLFFAALRFLSGTVLRRRLGNRPGFWRWWYSSYWEKLACEATLALILASPALWFYGIGFSVACLYTKRLLPGKEECQEVKWDVVD